ncbi:MAG TPA: hypothetical protein VG603_00295, partial [Chitinophagales bacterium]|nr:hypothetical protein [Chitinophagales bacterium]
YNLHNYYHYQVLRQIATPALGDTINMSVNKEIIRTYSVDISNYNLSHLYANVFVTQWGARSSTNHDVYNARRVKIGGIAKWE